MARRTWSRGNRRWMGSIATCDGKKRLLTLRLIKPTDPFRKVGRSNGETQMSEKQSQLQVVEKEFQRELKVNQKALNALLATTFKNFSPDLMQKAIFEGMMRGFTFKDFLQKDVYAIPYGQSYSLVSSIDFSRKIAMRSGLSGKSEPIFKETENGKIVSCTITVKRNVAGSIGDYTATVYFDEYDTGKNLWLSKPHTMIAKVAEMHALRSAFPEEMAKQYITEEMQKGSVEDIDEENLEEYEEKLKEAKSVEEIKSVWASLPQKAKTQFKGLASELKDSLKKAEKNESTKV